jgi:integrase
MYFSISGQAKMAAMSIYNVLRKTERFGDLFRVCDSKDAGIQTIRTRIREISIDAGARRSDGTPLVLLPHDCRRVFASEHLNNNTHVRVIQALLGHASPDTVMIYAKLYPGQLIAEYRKTVRSSTRARPRRCSPLFSRPVAL